MRIGSFAAVVSASLIVPAAARATTILSENFDGGSINSTYAYTNSSGAPGGTVNLGGTHQNVAQLASLSDGGNNSIAFNAVPIPANNQIVLSFDMYVSSDAVNNNAGGCCNSAGDGEGIGLFPTSQYGMSGGANPSAAEGFSWDGPIPSQGLALGIGLFQNSSMNLQWNGSTIAGAFTDFSLKNDEWDRFIITLNASGTNTLVNVDVIENVDGTPVLHSNVLSATATGLDIADGLGTDYRLIAGGGTGSAWNNGYLDNVQLSAIPEPNAIALLCFGGLLIHSRRLRLLTRAKAAGCVR